jgi:glycosyltransferase involved in cell wall biosynthesis
MKTIEISVVVATMNRAEELGDLLASLERQSFTAFEVVVVNDGSTDATAETLERFRQRTALNFRFLSQQNRGVSAARNVGVSAARGRLVAFTDDDCILPPDWLEGLFRGLEQQPDGVAGVGGPLDTVVKNPHSLAGRFVKNQDDFNHIPVFGSLVIRHRHVSLIDERENMPYLRTSNAIFRKDALLAVGGFDEAFRQPGGEDPDLCYRIISHGWHLRLKKDVRVAHKSRDNFSSYFRSLRNYLRGEFRKSRKRQLYLEPVIRRTYCFLLCRKIAVAGVFTVTFPAALFFSMRRFGGADGLVFALVTLLTKYSAVGVTAKCRYDAVRGRFH